MTGDGAVVLRKWEYHGGRGGDSFSVHAINEHNALIDHALSQAAEIERLTRERDNAKTEVKSWIKVALNFRTTAEDSEVRTADLLKALERYGKHDAHCPHAIDTRLMGKGDDRIRKCTCGLVAAAKGGTHG